MVPDKVASSDNVEHHVYVISFFMERFIKRGKSSQDKTSQIRSDKIRSDQVSSGCTRNDRFQTSTFMIASIEPHWPAEEVVVGEEGLGEEAAARATSAHGQAFGVQPETTR